MRRFILTAVTDSGSLPQDVDLLDRVRRLCDLGARRMVLRAKDLSEFDYMALAKDFVDICRRSSVIPVIAHHAEIAMEFDTELQLSMEELEADPDITKKVDVCVSVHSLDEAVEAESMGAVSVTAGHIYDTDSKKGVPGRGLDFLKNIIYCLKIPVYAIGGINADNIAEIYQCGASGVCLMSTMMNSSDDNISKIVRICSDLNRPVFDKKCLALYAVTDSRWLKSDETIASKVEKAILGGATMVQLREKDADRDSFLRDAIQCLRVCRSYSIPLVINDEVSIAKEIGADGIHLGQGDEDPAKVRKEFKRIIGVSAHNIGEADDAFDVGADYIGCGAVFQTSTKGDTEALGIVGLRRIAKASKLPVVAIGGIDKDNVSKLKGCGLSGVAVVSAIFSRGDITESTKELSDAVTRMIEQNV